MTDTSHIMQSFSPDKIELSAPRAVGVALSIIADNKTMDQCQQAASGFIVHLRNLGYVITPVGE